VSASGRRRIPLATPEEVAAYLRKSEGTLANWRSQGKGPRWTKPGGSILYDWADVYDWVAAQPGGKRDRPGHRRTS
jgi:Helix-turn-helix domain